MKLSIKKSLPAKKYFVNRVIKEKVGIHRAAGGRRLSLKENQCEHERRLRHSIAVLTKPESVAGQLNHHIDSNHDLVEITAKEDNIEAADILIVGAFFPCGTLSMCGALNL